MKITFLKQHGQLAPYSAEDKTKLDKMADGAAYVVDIKNMDIRTLTQNKALHKYFELLGSNIKPFPEVTECALYEWFVTASKAYAEADFFGKGEGKEYEHAWNEDGFIKCWNKGE